jgi:hypothetical protein
VDFASPLILLIPLTFVLIFLPTEPPLERYLDLEYEPCAVICTQCQGMESVDGVPLNVDYGEIQLFLED